MLIKITLSSDFAKVPVSAHESDTGYDIFAASEPNIVGEKHPLGGWKHISYIEYDTGISVAPSIRPLDFANDIFALLQEHPKYYGYLDVRPRSSLSKYNLALVNPPATIDHAYRGTIKLRFRYIFQPEDLSVVDSQIFGKVNMDKIYKKGDKIGQLVAAWKEPITWQEVDKLDDTERADGGFGSSGR